MIDSKRIIAHRGAWKDFGYEENSIQAFKKAQELPIGGIEFDLQFTKDEEVILFHDDDINGKYISGTNYRDINIGKKKILKFVDLLRCWNGEQTLWIDIKPSNLSELQQRDFVKKILDQVKGLSNIHFISFEINILKEIRKVSTLPCSFLGEEYLVRELHSKNISGIDAEYYRYMENDQLLEGIKTFNMVSNTWTVNDYSIGVELLKMGVDFITTDEVLMFIS